MRYLGPLLRASLGLALLLQAPNRSAAQELAFYEAQLRAGKEASTARRPLEAIDHLRIAAFGFLEQPALLSESLSRLALAQQAVGHLDKLGATLDRLLEVERRFGSWGAAGLEPQTRTALRRLLQSREPGVLAAFPSLAADAPRERRGSEVASRAAPPSTQKPPPPTPVTPVPRIAKAPEGDLPVQRTETPIAEAVYSPPRYRPTTKPLYPLRALRQHVGGIVLLRVLVSERGEVMEIDVVREVHPDLSAAAVGAVRLWDFEPATRNGVPVEAWITVPIPFRP